jgi:hypothetical protein
MARIDIDIEDYLDEVSTFDLIDEIFSRTLSNREKDSIKESLGIEEFGEVRNLDDDLKHEEWCAVKNQKTAMQWREFFEMHMNNQVHGKTSS